MNNQTTTTITPWLRSGRERAMKCITCNLFGGGVSRVALGAPDVVVRLTPSYYAYDKHTHYMSHKWHCVACGRVCDGILIDGWSLPN